MSLLRKLQVFSSSVAKLWNIDNANTARTTSTVVGAVQNVDATGKVPPAGDTLSNAPYTKGTIYDSGGTEMFTSSNPGNVIIVQNSTEIIDLHFYQQIQSVTVNTGVAIDDTTIIIDAGSLPVAGKALCLREGVSFYQGEILSVADNGGGNYTLTVDTPFDFAFTTGATAEETTFDLNVDGSSTPSIFKISPTSLTAGTTWEITRIIGIITDATVMDDSKFGGLTAITNGIVIRMVDGITKNIFNAKTNSDLKLHTYDVEYSSKAPAGSYGLVFRRTFSGAEKNNSIIKLETDTNDELNCIIQDDLTGLTRFHLVAQGRVI